MSARPKVPPKSTLRGSRQGGVTSSSGGRRHHQSRACASVKARLNTALHCLLVVALLSALVGTQGCAYNYRVQVINPDPATEYQRRTVNNFWWGLSPDPPIVTSNCVANAMDEVHVETNFGYLLLSVVTLGIWVPLDVEWKCAKEHPPVKPIGQ
jgi:hypothetical protein